MHTEAPACELATVAVPRQSETTKKRAGLGQTCKIRRRAGLGQTCKIRRRAGLGQTCKIRTVPRINQCNVAVFVKSPSRPDSLPMHLQEGLLGVWVYKTRIGGRGRVLHQVDSVAGRVESEVSARFVCVPRYGAGDRLQQQ